MGFFSTGKVKGLAGPSAEGSLEDSEKIDRRSMSGASERAQWDSHPGGTGALNAVYREYLSRTMGPPVSPPPPRW